MNPITKHRIIAAILHLLNDIAFVIVGYAVFIMSGAFLTCSSEAGGIDGQLCIDTAAMFMGIPALVFSLPIIAVLFFGRISKAFLWVYSVLIIVLLFPIGTLIGLHSIHLLKLTKNEQQSV